MVQIQDRPGEKEGYLDEKQKPVRSPMCFFLCVCVISLHMDSLMAVGIVNSSIASFLHLHHGGPIN